MLLSVQIGFDGKTEEARHQGDNYPPCTRPITQAPSSPSGKNPQGEESGHSDLPAVAQIQPPGTRRTPVSGRNGKLAGQRQRRGLVLFIKCVADPQAQIETCIANVAKIKSGVRQLIARQGNTQLSVPLVGIEVVDIQYQI